MSKKCWRNSLIMSTKSFVVLLLTELHLLWVSFQLSWRAILGTRLLDLRVQTITSWFHQPLNSALQRRVASPWHLGHLLSQKMKQRPYSARWWFNPSLYWLQRNLVPSTLAKLEVCCNSCTMYNISCKENLALTFVKIRRAEIPCTYFAMTLDFVLTMRIRKLEVMDIFFLAGGWVENIKDWFRAQAARRLELEGFQSRLGAFQ